MQSHRTDTEANKGLTDLTNFTKPNVTADNNNNNNNNHRSDNTRKLSNIPSNVSRQFAASSVAYNEEQDSEDDLEAYIAEFDDHDEIQVNATAVPTFSAQQPQPPTITTAVTTHDESAQQTQFPTSRFSSHEGSDNEDEKATPLLSAQHGPSDVQLPDQI